MALKLREIEVFRPYDNEFPEALMISGGADESCIDQWRAASMVRIAKLGEDIVGVYAMTRRSQLDYLLHGVIVAPRVRRRGLGRWLVGHAIGVAESKGGRVVTVGAAAGTRMFMRLGFSRSNGGWKFELVQE